MNAETRAKAVMDSLEPVLEPLSFYAFNKLEELMSAAITQAENEKLEEARQRILEGHDEAWGNPAEQHGWGKAAQRIEALKSKD